MMKRLLALLAALHLWAAPALADSTIDGLAAAAAIGGTESIPIFQTANPAVKTTPSAIKTYVFGLVSGDFTCTSGGACTLATVGVAKGGTGLTSGTSGGVLAFTASGTLASSGALTANLPVIGGGAGVAPTVGTRSGNTTSFATTSGSLTSGNCLKSDASGNIVDNGAVCAGAGAAPAITINAQTGATYTYVNGDCGKLVTRINAAIIADTLPQAGGGGSFASTCTIIVENIGSAPVVITPTTSTIDGVTTLTLNPDEGVIIVSDGTNYNTQRGIGDGLHPGYLPGATRYYPTSPIITAGAAITVNLQYCYPFSIYKRNSIIGFALRVSGAGTASHVNIGIYPNVSSRPNGAPLVVSNASTLTTSAGATITAAITAAPIDKGLYWMCTLHDGSGAPTLNSVGSGTGTNVMISQMIGTTTAGTAVTSSASHVVGLSTPITFGNMPTLASPTWTEVTALTVPHVAIGF